MLWMWKLIGEMTCTLNFMLANFTFQTVLWVNKFVFKMSHLQKLLLLLSPPKLKLLQSSNIFFINKQYYLH